MKDSHAAFHRPERFTRWTQGGDGMDLPGKGSRIVFGGRLEVAGEGKRRDQAAGVERQYWERLLHGGGHLGAIVKLSAVKLLGIYK